MANTQNTYNIYKCLLQNLNNDRIGSRQYNLNLKRTVNFFVTALIDDEFLYNEGESISDCAMYVPRLSSSYDKTHRIAHRIALILFPTQSTEGSDIYEDEKVHTYVRYHKLLSRLRKKCMEQTTIANSVDKKSHRIHTRKNFCSLKSRSISHLVAKPKPMPVDVAKLNDLKPFVTFISSNTPIDKPIHQFSLGTVYDDKRMDLCKQVVGPTHINLLMDSLKTNTQIEHFLLGNNIIGLSGAKAIADFINAGHASRIKTWYLAGNKINSKGIKLIADALAKDTRCDALWLKRNPIMTAGARALGTMLKANQNIKLLDLFNTGIMDDGVKYLIDGLCKNTTLTSLYLDANGITTAGAGYLAKYFDHMAKNNLRGITSLWLSMNRIDDDGIIQLANSLRNYTHLKRLVVSSNRIGVKGASVLLEILGSSTSLRVLDLGLYKATYDLGELPNNIGDEGVNAIADFIRVNKSVEILDITHNNISANDIKLIADAMELNHSIMHLAYNQYGLEVPTELKTKISDVITRNISDRYIMTKAEYNKQIRPYVKSTKRIRHIASIYRNKM